VSPYALDGWNSSEEIKMSDFWLNSAHCKIDASSQEKMMTEMILEE
jgi:hypothetical protein